jgi:hypothetical protein
MCRQNCVAACADVVETPLKGSSADEWAEWKECLKLWSNQLDSQMGQPYELDRRAGQQLMALSCCLVVHASVVKALDKKLALQIWDFHKKVAWTSATLCSAVSVFFDSFRVF